MARSRNESASLLEAPHPHFGRIFAAVSSEVRFEAPQLGTSRFAARLHPFPDVESARAAIEAAGLEPSVSP